MKLRSIYYGVLMTAGACMLLGSVSCNHNSLIAELAYAGHPRAQYELGRRMLTGTNGMKRRPEKALPWLRLAASGGENRAMAAIALCYEQGLGVDKSPEQARLWYRRAAEKGNTNACLALVRMASQKGNMAEVLQWLRPVAEAGSRHAQILCAKLCFAGHAGKGNEASGVRYLRFAAMQGDPEACLLMAGCYASGVGVPKNEALMLGWLSNAAQAGSERAKELLKLAKKPIAVVENLPNLSES